MELLKRLGPSEAKDKLVEEYSTGITFGTLTLQRLEKIARKKGLQGF
ncbi:hypothetical protein [Pyrococcus yayanosii]|uniref:Uncharacterized protein n=1 Tax=Pyrococcus yayanosii (strain CH1 / JCM 16557) TaxID=529709 RepID=F8AFY1_PYRYC|nr:hypothetical protein [Pyrococcus yayanosii]AEH23887.1 hypothetical protein PYCH_01780 [Pyrococcus yayanosii CH1]